MHGDQLDKEEAEELRRHGVDDCASLPDAEPNMEPDVEPNGGPPLLNVSFNPENFDPDLVATVASLGSYEGPNYVIGEECAICISDLIKFLRIEDNKICDIRRQLAHTKVLEKDLLPILTTYFENMEIIEPMMRLLVNLTMPPILCFEKEETHKKDMGKETLQIEVNNYLRNYKLQFVIFNVMKVFSSQLARLLELGKANRADDDDLMLERILIIIRNILFVHEDAAEDQQVENSLSTHDKVVLSIIEYGVADLLFYLCGSKDEEQHCLLTLEIISLIFRDFDASTLANQNSGQGNELIDKELQELKLKEDLQKQKRLSTKNTRHSRFGGTFVVQGKKSISNNDLIYHKSVKKIKNLTFDNEKTIRRHTGFHSIVTETASKRFSTADTRNKLKALAQKFLDVCYNPLMKKAKSFLCRGQGTSECDETFYLWACQFFMEFNRLVGFKLELVAETLSTDTFSYILQVIFKFHGDVNGFSSRWIKKQRLWGKRLHNGIKAYREMLENLCLMLVSKDSKIKSIASVIQNTIFYQQEYRELPTLLFKQFKRSIFTKSYLTDLIECTHLYIKMLEAFTKDNTLIVQETKKKSKKKKKTAKKRKNLLSEREMMEMWEGDIEKEVMGIISAGSISTRNVRPFDASSDYSMEQQRIKCKHDIQDLLKSGSFDEAVALYKAAQEVWASSPSFGMPDMSIIDEVNVIKSIFMSNEEVPEMMTTSNDAGEIQHQETGEQEMERGEIHHVTEHKFQNTAYLTMYTRPGIVNCFCYILQDFETNSQSLNHAVVKMLHRIANKLAMAAIMFQVTFFVTCKKILEAPKIDAYKDLKKFATFIVKKFIVSLKETPMICLDTLFWKTIDDVMAIDNNYDAEKLMPLQKVTWTSPEEEEVKALFEKWLDKAQAIDICDMIAQDMVTSSDKQRIDVKRKIIELKLVGEESADILKKKPKNKVDWLPDEKEALTKLYEEYRYERDPVALIQEKLDTKSRKKIIKGLESFLGVRKSELDISRSIWEKDDDDELRILYEHKSEDNTGDALLEIIRDNVSKTRTMKEVKDALIRLKLTHDENSSDHFWTKGELAVVDKYTSLLSKKEMILKIKADLPYIGVSPIIQKLVHLKHLAMTEGADLLLQVDEADGDDGEDESDEDEEEEFDFFEIPGLVKQLKMEHQAALKWIAGICQSILNSREELLDYDTVFIIPKNEDHREALREKLFNNLLMCIGAVPPLSSYETYWKISSEVSDNILRRALVLLQGKEAMSDCEGDVSDASFNADNSHIDASSVSQPSRAALDDSSDDDMDSFFSRIRSQKTPAAPKPSSDNMVSLSDEESSQPTKSLDRPSLDSKEDIPDKQSAESDNEMVIDEDISSDKENMSSIGQVATKRKSNKMTSDSESDSETINTTQSKKKRTAIINWSDSDD